MLAVTGSNGKTSVKALTFAILEAAVAALGAPGRAYTTPGNRNNEIGLPLAVIDAPDDALYAMYEMGAGKPGDIAYLTDIVRPDVSLVNNVAPAHLERLGSLFGIADTKAAIYDALPADGVAAINADDAFAPYFAERAHGRRLIRFALEADADVTARDLALDAEGSRFVWSRPRARPTSRWRCPAATTRSTRSRRRRSHSARAFRWPRSPPVSTPRGRCPAGSTCIGCPAARP